MMITKGFLMTVGNKHYFMESDTTKRTDKVVEAFIERIGTDKGRCRDLIDRAKADRPTRADFRKRINAAAITKRTPDTGEEYFVVEGKGFYISYSVDSFCDTVIVF